MLAGEACDRLVDLPERLSQQRRHASERGVRRAGHHLRLADSVLGAVEDPVDAAREGEDVLRLERDDECRAKGRWSLALRSVGAMLGGSHGVSRVGIATRPRDERVQALDRDRRLASQLPEDVG